MDLRDADFGTIPFLTELQAIPADAVSTGASACASLEDNDGECSFVGDRDGVVYSTFEGLVWRKELNSSDGKSAAALPLGLTPGLNITAARRLLRRHGLGFDVGREASILSIGLCDVAGGGDVTLNFDGKSGFKTIVLRANTV